MKIANKINKELIKSENPKYITPELKEILKEKEDLWIQQAIKQTLLEN